jgi:SAM-dependent methyltransferase
MEDVNKVYCTFCNNELLQVVHTPIGSKRGMEVYRCSSCELLQSHGFKNYISRPKGSMSCNADRASIKYTKSLVHADQLNWLTSIGIDIYTFRSILDIGANRATFCLDVLKNTKNLIHYHAVETDPDFENLFLNLDDRIHFELERVENVVLKEESYDFIYCIHTLEHVYDLKRLLVNLNKSLKDDGYLYISVPNILSGAYTGFSEIFIDPHTIHFEHATIQNVLTLTGFEILHISDDNLPEIKVLVRRSAVKKSLGVSPSLDVEKYKNILTRNREKLAITSSFLTSYGGLRVFWGAGRTFDALVRIGRLELRDNDILVDRAVGGHFEKLFNLEVNHPKILSSLDSNEEVIIVVCAVEYYEEIVFEASEYGFSNFLKLF